MRGGRCKLAVTDSVSPGVLCISWFRWLRRLEVSGSLRIMSAEVVERGMTRTAVAETMIAPALGNGGDSGDAFVPRFPQKVEELDVSAAFLADLTLKAVALDADCTTASVASRIRVDRKSVV